MAAQHDTIPLGSSFHPNGRVLAVSQPGNTIALWELASGKQRVQFTGAGDRLAFAPDGRLLAAAGAEGTIHLAGREMQRVDLDGGIELSFATTS